MPPLEFSGDYIGKIKAELPELPAQKIKRFQDEYKLSEYDAETLSREGDLAEFFEEAVSEACELCEDREKISKLTVNYILTALKKYLSENVKINDLKLTAENFGELISLVAKDKINSSAAQVVLDEMIRTGADPEHIIAEKNLAQIEDDSEIEKIVGKVISENPKPAGAYKAGKQAALQFLLGQVMKETKGKVNPKIAMKVIKDALDKD